MLRNSERGTLKKCEFLWDLTYNRLLKPQTEMPALRFGSLIHQALAAYYVPGVKRGESPVTAFERAYAEDLKVNTELFGMRVEEDDVWVNALELGIAMMKNYLEEYGADDGWEVLVTEYPFEIVVHHPACELCGAGTKRTLSAKVVAGCPDCGGQGGQPWFLYVGVLDGVWRKRKDKTIWIPDHKSTAGIGPKTTAHLQLDDQAGSYWSWGVDALVRAELLKKNQKLNGMLYNFMRKALPDERPSKIINKKRVYLNKDGTVSLKQPSPYFLRQPIFRDEFDRAQAKHRSEVDFRRMELFRSGELEISKSPGMFTCPSCAMRDACELHETGADWESFISQTTKTWDPYAEHEVYDGR
jgi:hypothetical protein